MDLSSEACVLCPPWQARSQTRPRALNSLRRHRRLPPGRASCASASAASARAAEQGRVAAAAKRILNQRSQNLSGERARLRVRPQPHSGRFGLLHATADWASTAAPRWCVW
eukprot:5299326-Pleurochrysis_carterae.AAC.1